MTPDDKWLVEWATFRGPIIAVRIDQRIHRGEMVAAEPDAPLCVIRFDGKKATEKIHPKWVRPDEWAMTTNHKGDDNAI